MVNDRRAAYEPVPQSGFDEALVASAGPRVIVENRVKQKSELRCDQHQRETDMLKNPGKPSSSSKSPNTRLVKSAMRTQEIPPRKYAMMRLGKGDYLLPSNDLTVMWRLHSYNDGHHHGLDVPYEDRTFWRAVWMPMDAAQARLANNELPDPWATNGPAWEWREADWFLPTRKAAVEAAMKHDARRMADG